LENEKRLEDLLRQLGNVVEQHLKASREHQEVLMAMYAVMDKSDPKFVSRFRTEIEEIRRRSRPTESDNLASKILKDLRE
jgi:hypothetical protein